MRVRDASSADLPVMAAIDSGSVEGSERWAEFQHLLTRGWVLLAEDLSDDSPLAVGYVAVVPEHFFGRDFIALLVVAEACRRRGVGRGLLRAATLRATSEAVFTSTNESNHPMLELLKVEGWTVSGRLEGLDAGDPEIVFYRDAKSDA
jgi:GNAT superfamily N-acetyltransferase